MFDELLLTLMNGQNSFVKFVFQFTLKNSKIICL